MLAGRLCIFVQIIGKGMCSEKCTYIKDIQCRTHKQIISTAQFVKRKLQVGKHFCDLTFNFEHSIVDWFLDGKPISHSKPLKSLITDLDCLDSYQCWFRILQLLRMDIIAKKIRHYGNLQSVITDLSNRKERIEYYTTMIAQFTYFYEKELLIAVDRDIISLANADEILKEIHCINYEMKIDEFPNAPEIHIFV